MLFGSRSVGPSAAQRSRRLQLPGTSLRLWWLLLILAAGFAVLFASVAERGRTATAFDGVARSSYRYPTSGYQPAIDNWKTGQGARRGHEPRRPTYVATNKYTGTFTLTDVPAGPVTLIYVETPGEDTFTMESAPRGGHHRRLDWAQVQPRPPLGEAAFLPAALVRPAPTTTSGSRTGSAPRWASSCS